MSCINITPLVLSDTFNTWFERTNESISALNSFEIRGLSASTTDGVRGLKFVDAGSCYYSLALETGPFIGFVTGEGVDKGIYGTGDATSPYKLTFVASGPTMSAEAVTGDDYALVSDTSDGGLFKLAPVNSFITNIVGGNNISVTLTNGTYTISYVELSFSPTMTISGITTNNSNLSYEIKEGGLLDNGTITFTIENGGDVNHDGGNIVLSSSGRVDGFDTITFTSSDTSKSDTGVTLPYDVSWFTRTTRSITFTATFTPQSTSGGVPYSGGNATVPRTIYFGWKFGGCDSTTQYTSASTFATALSGSLTDLLYESSSTWSATGASALIFGDPTVTRFFTISIASNSSYIYFVHTDSASGYGWTPTLLQDNGSVVNDGLVDIGTATISGNTYRVWRSSETYNAGTKTFGIK